MRRNVINIPRKLERFLCLAFVLSPCVEGLFLFRNHLKMFSPAGQRDGSVLSDEMT